MINTKTLRNARGFTLIEAAIVLTIVGLVIGGIWLAASTVYNNKKKGDLASDVVQIVQNVRNTYNGQTDASTLTTANAIQAGIVPANLVSGAQAVHAFNSTPGSLTITGAATQFTITLLLVPRDACIEMLAGRLAQSQSSATRIGLVSAKGTGAVITDFTGGITPAEATATCTGAGTNGTDTVTIVFTLN